RKVSYGYQKQQDNVELGGGAGTNHRIELYGADWWHPEHGNGVIGQHGFCGRGVEWGDGQCGADLFLGAYFRGR
ncbi:putative holin protein of phage, partial [Serratia symbiotica str. Tucson]